MRWFKKEQDPTYVDMAVVMRRKSHPMEYKVRIRKIDLGINAYTTADIVKKELPDDFELITITSIV